MAVTMDPIKEARLPGFYTDDRGVYGIILGRFYINCFINSDDGQYDVAVDTVDDKGDFAKNIRWVGFDDPADAIECLRRCGRL